MYAFLAGCCMNVSTAHGQIMEVCASCPALLIIPAFAGVLCFSTCMRLHEEELPEEPAEACFMSSKTQSPIRKRSAINRILHHGAQQLMLAWHLQV